MEPDNSALQHCANIARDDAWPAQHAGSRMSALPKGQPSVKFESQVPGRGSRHGARQSCPFTRQASMYDVQDCISIPSKHSTATSAIHTAHLELHRLTVGLALGTLVLTLCWPRFSPDRAVLLPGPVVSPHTTQTRADSQSMVCVHSAPCAPSPASVAPRQMRAVHLHGGMHATGSSDPRARFRVVVARAPARASASRLAQSPSSKGAHLPKCSA